MAYEDRIANKKAKIAKHISKGESKYSNLNRLAKRYDKMAKSFDSTKMYKAKKEKGLI